MAKKWEEVASNPEYQNLSSSEKEDVRKEYFENVVKPNVPSEDLAKAQKDFDQFSNPSAARKAINAIKSGLTLFKDAAYDAIDNRTLSEKGLLTSKESDENAMSRKVPGVPLRVDYFDKLKQQDRIAPKSIDAMAGTKGATARAADTVIAERPFNADVNQGTNDAIYGELQKQIPFDERKREERRLEAEAKAKLFTESLKQAGETRSADQALQQAVNKKPSQEEVTNVANQIAHKEEMQAMYGDIPKPEGMDVATNAAGRAVKTGSALAQNMIAFGASVVNADDLALKFLQSAAKTQDEAGQYPAALKDFTEIQSWSDIPTYALEGVIENAPMLVGSIGSGALGAFTAKNLGKNKLAKLTQEAAVKELAKRATIGATVGAGTASIGMESGSIFGDIYRETGEQRTALAAAGGIVAGAFDAIPAVMALKTALGGEVGEEAAKTIIKRYGVDGLKQIGAEGGTEFAQTWVEEIAKARASGNEVLSQQNLINSLDAMFKGGAAGGVTHIAAQGFNDLTAKKVEKFKTLPNENLQRLRATAEKAMPQDVPLIDAEIQRRANTPTLQRAVEAGMREGGIAQPAETLPASDILENENDGISDATSILATETDGLGLDNTEGSRRDIPETTGSGTVSDWIIDSTRPLEQGDGGDLSVRGNDSEGQSDITLNDVTAHAAATSDLNDTPQPTEAQKEKGNYKKGSVKISGMDISIENPHTSMRKGVDKDGTSWENQQNGHYGYIKGVVARAPDKEHVDVNVKPNTAEDYAGDVFVINQNHPGTGKFDEPKVYIGYGSKDEAEAAYRSNYADGWNGLDSVAQIPMEQFKEMLNDEKAFLKPVELKKQENEVLTPIETIDVFKEKGRAVSNKIDLAQNKDGKWVAGYSFQDDKNSYNGGGRAAQLSDIGFDTKEEAISDVAAKIAEFIKTPSLKSAWQKHIKQLEGKENGLQKQGQKTAQKINKQTPKVNSLLSKIFNLGGITSNDKLDVTGQDKSFAPGGYNKIFKKQSRQSLRGLIENGDLDEFLPHNMRVSAIMQDSEAYDSTEAYDYLADKIRAGEKVLPYEAQQEIEQNKYQEDLTAEEHVDLVASTLTEDKINEQFRIAANEEREASILATDFIPDNEDGVIESSQREAIGKQTEPQTVTAQEREGVRPIVEAIAKRRAAANQINKAKAFDVNLQLAKDFMAGKDVKPVKFTTAATLFNKDSALNESFNKLAEMAKAPAKEARAEKANIVESYKQRISEAKTADALQTIAGEIQRDSALSDTQAQALDDIVFDAQDKFETSEPEAESLTVQTRRKELENAQGIWAKEPSSLVKIALVRQAEKKLNEALEISNDVNAETTNDSDINKQSSKEVDDKQAIPAADLLGDNTAAKQAIADVERAKDAKRNEGIADTEGFTLTGSNSEADKAAAAGAQDLFSQPTKEEPKGALKDTSDVGIEMLGNRRNKGLTLADIQNANNDTERMAMAVKTKLWERPDYQALVDSGIQPVFAHIVKQVYDGLSSKPAFKGEKMLYDYVNTVEATKKAVDELLTNNNAMAEMTIAIAVKARQSSWMMNNSINELGGISKEIKANENALNFLVDRVFPKNEKGARWGRQNTEGNDKANATGNRFYKNISLDLSSFVDAIKAVEQGFPAKQEAWERSYQIKEKDGKFQVIKKGRYTPKSEHASRDDAVNAARELVKRQREEQFKEPETPVEKSVRKGREIRTQGNVSSQELKETIGLKAVNFGDWMKQPSNAKERQEHVNSAFDAFHDLAEVINVPVKAMSLDGMLGLAIGAQGKGKFAAHFYPGYNEINLTRMSGAGSLAHEWAHGLDHYFGVKAGLATRDNPFASWIGRYSNLPDSNIRKEVADAFNAIVKTMRDTTETVDAAKARIEATAKASKDRLNSYIERNGLKDAVKDDAKAQSALDAIIAGERGEYIEWPALKGKRKPQGFTSEHVKVLADKLGWNFDRAYDLNLTLAGHSAAQEALKIEPELRKIHTEYYREASRLDAGKKDAYWTTPHELFARAFEMYVADKIANADGRNDYLVAAWKQAEEIKTGNAFADEILNEAKKRYPQGNERQAINDAFDVLFKEIQTKESDDGNVVMFSRSKSTQQIYENRIDDLFADGKADFKGTGVKVLDKSDMLNLLGYGGKPVYLSENKVQQGKYNHGLTAEHWKKIPEWLDDPALVFDSDTVTGRLVFIAPELLNGAPIRIIVDPDATANGLKINLVVNAYDAKGKLPFGRWVKDGLLRFYSKAKSLAILARSGLQLSSMAKARSSNGRIYQDSDLVNYKNEDIRFSQKPIFYSALTRAVDEIKINKAPVAQWKAIIKNLAQKGVKPDEIEWTGINEFLDLQQGQVTKQSVVDYLNANGIQVEETVLGNIDEGIVEAWWNDEGGANEETPYSELSNQERTEAIEQYKNDVGDYEDDATKYSKYTVPGGTNYKELLLTLPKKVAEFEFHSIAQMKEFLQNNPRKDLELLSDLDKLKQLNKERRIVGEQPKQYRSSHFEQPNILAHIRFDERTDAEGNKVLFINEIQSDWAQEGKKKGFVKKEPSFSDAKKYFGIEDETWNKISDVDKQSYVNEIKERGRHITGIQDAPFVTKTDAWVSLALKRMIRYASENSFDKVAIINGKQAGDLYSLAKQVDEIIVEKLPDGTFNIKATLPNGGGTQEIQNDVRDNELEGLIGKDLAKKVVNQDYGTEVYDGGDLEVGNEGMIGFYDKIVPKVAKDVLKKLGGNVEEVSIKDPSLFRKGGFVGTDDANVNQTGFSITPEMREKIMGGLPLFAQGNKKVGMPIADVEKEVKNFSKGWKRIPQVIVVDSMQDERINEHVRNTNKQMIENGATGLPIGFISQGKVYILAPMVNNKSDIATVMMHEIFGHAGLRANFGAKLDDILEQIYITRRKEVMAKAKQYGYDFTKHSDRLKAAEEVLAEMAQNNPQLGFVKRAIAAIRAWLRANIPYFKNMDITDDDIIGNILIPARNFIRYGKTGGSDLGLNKVTPVFSRTDALSQSEKLAHKVDPRDIETTGANGELYAPNGLVNKDGIWVSPTRADQTNNSGNDDIRFSRQGNLTPEWDAPEASKIDSLIYTLQDKHIDLKRVTENIKNVGNHIDDRWNAYLQEELYHGRAAKRTQDFIKHELEPLIKDMQERKVAMADFEEYLWMRHAPERNKKMASINEGSPDGLAGVSTKDAKEYLANLTDQQKLDFEALAERIDAINKASEQVLIDYGLESTDTIAKWNSVYEYYVPLMREEMENGSGNGTGQGFSVKGNASKRATGSKRAVVDIIANIAQQRERYIIRGEKNRVSTALIGLAKLNPNEDFWRTDTPPTKKDVSKITGMVEEYTDPNYKNRDNVIVARIPDKLGKIQERSVIFNEFDDRAMRMARSLKNLDQDQLHEVLGTASIITRYFSSINTQYNPIFGVINLLRDTQTAAINLSSTPLKGKQKEVMSHVLPALIGIYSDLRSERESGTMPTNEYAILFEEFQKEGGQTGYRDMYRNAKERSAAIEHALDHEWWTKTKIGKAISANGKFAAAEVWMNDKAVKPIFNWLSDYNEAMENAVRLSAYKVAIDNGLSKQQAASIAKNISVNFNRKGEMGRQIGSLYAFFNASVQGTARIADTLLKNDDGKYSLSKTGKTIVKGGLLLGVMQALLLAAAGYSDDDPPAYSKDRNLIIPLDIFGADNKYATIALPLGFNAIPAFSRHITEWALSGGEDTHDRVIQIIDMILNVTNPIGNAGLSLQTALPTLADPLAAIAENKDFTGRDISRKDFNQLDPTPGFTRSRDKAWDVSIAVARAMNWASGGTDYQPGWASPTADQIEYLAGQVTGGVGREIIKAGTTVDALISGEDLPSYKIPLLGRFYGDAASQSSQGAKFYKNITELNKIENELKGRAKNHEDVNSFKENNPEYRAIVKARISLEQVQNLRKRQRAMVEKGEDKDKIKVIDEKITMIMTRLNTKVEDYRSQANE